MYAYAYTHRSMHIYIYKAAKVDDTQWLEAALKVTTYECMHIHRSVHIHICMYVHVLSLHTRWTKPNGSRKRSRWWHSGDL